MRSLQWEGSIKTTCNCSNDTIHHHLYQHHWYHQVLWQCHLYSHRKASKAIHNKDSSKLTRGFTTVIYLVQSSSSRCTTAHNRCCGLSVSVHMTMTSTSNYADTTRMWKLCKPCHAGLSYRHNTKQSVTRTCRGSQVIVTPHVSRMDGLRCKAGNCHSGWQRTMYLALGFTWQTLIILAQLSNRLSPANKSQHQQPYKAAAISKYATQIYDICANSHYFHTYNNAYQANKSKN